jgi:hypothetical protein
MLMDCWILNGLALTRQRVLAAADHRTDGYLCQAWYMWTTRFKPH